MRRRNGLLTPTQKRMFNLLKDGKVHSIDEAFALMDDEYSELATASKHMRNLSKKLYPLGFAIMSIESISNGKHKCYYQLVALINENISTCLPTF